MGNMNGKVTVTCEEDGETVPIDQATKCLDPNCSNWYCINEHLLCLGENGLCGKCSGSQVTPCKKCEKPVIQTLMVQNCCPECTGDEARVNRLKTRGQKATIASQR